MKFQVLQGDCREVMKSLADCSVDAVVTDPPYELGFMGKSWDRSGIAYDVAVWSECLRVLRPGGHVLAFGGSRTYHRLACAIEDAGFEIRDQIQWVYASGFPKSLDVSKAIDAAEGAERKVISTIDARSRYDGALRRSSHDHSEGYGNITGKRMVDVTSAASDAAKQWVGWGTALKPAHEPIVLARKPLIGTVAENVLQHGTGGINIDGCRIETSDDLNGGAYAEHASERHDGRDSWRFRNGGGRSPLAGDEREGAALGMFQPGKTAEVGFEQPAGRWPANVIHDGSAEVLAVFPEAPGQQGDLNGHSKDRLSKGIFGDMKSARDAVARLDSGSAARFFYCAKATQEDRNEGLERLPHRVADETHKRPRTELDDPRRAGVTPRPNYHPTVKPVDLMRYLCKLVTPPGGLVLDPFCGSGSTGKAAMLEGLRFIGIELNADYCELAQLRIEAVTKQGVLEFT